MGWLSKVLGRRRPVFDVPTQPDPDRLRIAEAEAIRADEVLQRALADDQEVTRTSDRARRIHRQNHLGPSFWDWAESLGERKHP